ncbi:MAG: HupE/UreJ family protein [Parvibaculaceae bacterium]|nr:HupE/UreJ family protein [Parvibaculaceae bacterium]
MRFKLPFATLSASALILLPTLALAHPGHGETASFTQGLAHPLTGLDHILAMVMVGLFAVQLGGRALWLLPTTFVAAMAAGSLAGVTGIDPSAVELGIGLSIVLLGGLLAMQVRMPLVAAMAVVGTIALFHGYAHGAEAPGGVSLHYLGGFLFSTAILHIAGVAAGLGIARVLTNRHGQVATRVLGGLGAGAGILLLATA